MTGRSKFILSAGVALAAFAGVACGRANLVGVPGTGQVGGETARDMLIERMREGATIERVMVEMVGMLRAADRNADGLDRDDIALQRDVRRAQGRASAIGSGLAYDLDGDLKVTRAELARASRSAEPMREREVERQLARFDTDGDGTMTIAEMAASATERQRQDDEQLDRLLALDPNGDGRLTASELRKLVEQAFATIDRDGNGEISAAEYAPFADRARMLQMERHAPRCSLPAVPAGARLIAYGGYEGDAISSVAIGGPDEETNLIDVTIEAGSTPLYIVLTSYESMVWRIGGDTRRVAQVVVSSSKGDVRNISASGVVGLPQSRVAIAEPRCPSYFKGDDDNARTAAIATIRRATGREPDAMFGSYSARGISLPSGALSRAERDKAPVPRGFDGPMWREALRFWPGGLVAVDPRQVTARSRVERYSVLPSQMGLSQLLGSGAMLRDGNALRIVRPIPRFPSSMGGAHSVKLILGKGVPMPAGDPVHSCVVSDDGAVLGNRAICR